MAGMQISPYYEPESGTWTYLLADSGSGEAAIIDPVWVFDPVSGQADTAFTDRILDEAAGQGLVLRWVLETHAHADHLSSAGHIRARTGARVAIGCGITSVQENFIRVFGLQGLPADGSQFDRLLAQGDVLRLGALEIQVMETPGHTSDSLTYLVGDAAFIGDTLFAPAYGTARCDFPGGDAAQLYESITRIHALPPQTRLHLCHDYPADGAEPRSVVTVAESCSANIHVRDGIAREAFVRMREERDGELKRPRLIYPSLQVNIRAGQAPEQEANGTSFLRIPFNTALADLLRRDRQ